MLTRSSRGPSRCELSSNTEVAEMHFTLDWRFRIDTVCLPGMHHGVPSIIPCYCRVNPRWGRLHNVLRAYSHRVTVDPPLLEHGSSPFENGGLRTAMNRRCVNEALVRERKGFESGLASLPSLPDLAWPAISWPLSKAFLSLVSSALPLKGSL